MILLDTSRANMSKKILQGQILSSVYTSETNMTLNPKVINLFNFHRTLKIVKYKYIFWNGVFLTN